MEQPQKQENEYDAFSNTSEYIRDELELIQDQQDNLIKIADEIKKAFSTSNQLNQLLKSVKKTDKILSHNLSDRRKQESSLLNLIEDIKEMLKKEKYEELEKALRRVQLKSHEKIKLSQKELDTINRMADTIKELYKESAGICRLYQLVYQNLSYIQQECSKELSIESSEDRALKRAGSNT